MKCSKLLSFVRLFFFFYISPIESIRFGSVSRNNDRNSAYL